MHFWTNILNPQAMVMISDQNVHKVTTTQQSKYPFTGNQRQSILISYFIPYSGAKIGRYNAKITYLASVVHKMVFQCASSSQDGVQAHTILYLDLHLHLYIINPSLLALYWWCCPLMNDRRAVRKHLINVFHGHLECWYIATGGYTWRQTVPVNYWSRQNTIIISIS